MTPENHSDTWSKRFYGLLLILCGSVAAIAVLLVKLRDANSVALRRDTAVATLERRVEASRVLLHAVEENRKRLTKEGTALAAAERSAPTPAVADQKHQERAKEEGSAAPYNPEHEQYRVLRENAKIGKIYGALYRELHLSPQETTTFQKLLADRNLLTGDIVEAAREQGITPESSAGRGTINELVNKFRQEYDQQIREALGDVRYDQLRLYERTVPERNIVNELAQRLQSGLTPLSQEQIEHLVEIVNRSRDPHQGEIYFRRSRI